MSKNSTAVARLVRALAGWEQSKPSAAAPKPSVRGSRKPALSSLLGSAAMLFLAMVIVALNGTAASAQDLLLIGAAADGTPSVVRYNGTTGAPVGPFANLTGLDSPDVLRYGPDGNLYVSALGGFGIAAVRRYNGATGALVLPDPFIPSSLSQPNALGLAWSPAGHLYVGRSGAGSTSCIRVYDLSGASLGILACRDVLASAFQYMAFGPDGGLYVSHEGGSASDPGIARYNVTTIPAVTPLDTAFPLLSNPGGLAFGPDGKLYVASTASGTVVRISTSTFTSEVVPGLSGLNSPRDLTFGPDGRLYILQQGTRPQVLRYDLPTGALTVFAQSGVPGTGVLTFENKSLVFMPPSSGGGGGGGGGVPTLPDITAGLTYHALGADALTWTPAGVFKNLNGTLTALQVTAAGAPISNVQGIVYHPLGADAIVWTPTGVFKNLNGTLTALQITAGGVPISNVQGVVYHPLGADAIIWTPTKVFKNLNGTVTALEITADGASISNVQGVVYHPLGADTIVWTPTGIFKNLNGTVTALDITAGGASISNVRGVVYHPLGADAIVWTPAGVFKNLNGTLTALEITAGGASVSNVRGIIYHPLGSDAIVWTPTGVFKNLNGTLTALDITAAGAPITNVQGVVYHPLGADAIVRTPTGVFKNLNGTLTALEITAGGASINNVRGIVYHPLGADAIVWTPAGVFKNLNGTLTALEITAGGASINNVRGIVYHPLGADAIVWTPTGVFKNLNGTLTALNITAGGASISNVQGVVYHPLGADAIVWTPARAFKNLNGTITALEIKIDGTTSIFSYDSGHVSRVQVVVHHVGSNPPSGDHHQPVPGPGVDSGASAAGIVGSPAITPVGFTGSSSAATVVPFLDLASLSHSTIVGAAPFSNTSLILGPSPVAGVVAGNAMKLFAFVSLPGCSYDISPASRSMGASGGAGAVSVTAPDACAWKATSDASWITITSGDTGSGNGVVTYAVAPNTASSSRAGKMAIADHTFVVTQAGAASCTYSLGAPGQAFAAGGGAGFVSVTAPGGCGWTARSNASWITITSGTVGSGNGAVSYSVAANIGASPRSGDITIAGQAFSVTQAGAASPRIDVLPSSWDFGSVRVGSTNDKEFVVQNTGTATLTVSAASVFGVGATEFGVQSGAEAFSLSPGETHTVVVRFTPASPGSKTASLRFNSNDPDSNPRDVALAGTGRSPDTTPVVSVVSYARKRLRIVGRNFDGMARVEINGRVIDRDFDFDPTANSLSIRARRRLLNLTDGDNQIVVIQNSQRSVPFILQL